MGCHTSARVLAALATLFLTVLPASTAAAGGASAASSAVVTLQEDLAQLGYLPVGWNGRSFTYPAQPMPAPLRALFAPGRYDVLVRGAVMSYAAQRGIDLRRTGLSALLADLRGDVAAGRRAQKPFTYVYVDASTPERLVVWSTSGVVRSTAANTGVAGAVTPLGTYPVYLRLPFQIMRGHDLNGAAYADPVHWISYFVGGDAVHGFVRAAYGFPQSLGCVELPLAQAQAVYAETQVGTLVTIARGPLTFVAPPPGSRTLAPPVRSPD